jgi:nicotinate-nucleotide pyrophosphorylase (carboxylating)
MDLVSKRIIKLAYIEDVGNGDVTSNSTIKRNARGKAHVVAKSGGVLSGSDAFRYAYALSSRNVRVTFHIRDTESFKAGDRIATVSGSSRALLRGERLALNLLSHLSGVATLASRFAAKIAGTRTKILDTRKTMPGLRELEKLAVKHGGGQNHRMGLYDMILIKDNHIKAAGGIDKALERVAGAKFKVEVEVASFAELKLALQYSPDIIMLDNFPMRQISKAVKLVKAKNRRIKIEISGGINLDNVRDYARAGVDYISVGALTHSAPAADFSMRYI